MRCAPLAHNAWGAGAHHRFLEPRKTPKHKEKHGRNILVSVKFLGAQGTSVVNIAQYPENKPGKLLEQTNSHVNIIILAPDLTKYCCKINGFTLWSE